MSKKNLPEPMAATQKLQQDLATLKLSYCLQEYAALASQANQQQWEHTQFLQCLMTGEVQALQDRRTQRRLDSAKFPVRKTLDQFDWQWPESLNELQVKHLFRFGFIQEKANVIFLGSVGLGKTHLSIALGYQACLQGYSVLFSSAVEIINALTAAHALGRLKSELAKYLKPQLLIVDELGYLPIDKTGADLLFQVISGRYERGSLVISTNKAFADWTAIFNHDASLTSAVLDRLLHYAEVIQIAGKSYRMRGKVDT